MTIEQITAKLEAAAQMTASREADHIHLNNALLDAAEAKLGRAEVEAMIRSIKFEETDKGIALPR